jgi:hypothetical protein
MRIPRSWRFVAAAFAIAATSCDKLPTENAAYFEPSNVVVIDGFTVAREKLPLPLPTLTATSTIGAAGGSLTILGHTLSVPAGAVSSPTLFTIAVQPTGLIEVELTAMQIPEFGLPVPITQFDVPLQLSLSYSRSRDRAIMRETGVIIHVDGVNATPVRSRVRPAQKKVVATLWHFSRYMMASN